MTPASTNDIRDPLRSTTAQPQASEPGSTPRQRTMPFIVPSG